MHGVRPWTEGGGPSGTLVWSTEGQDCPGIDASQIERLATSLFGDEAERRAGALNSTAGD